MGTLFKIQSALILTLLTIGLIYRRERAKHVKIMLTAMVWDIILILQIELSRSAIAKASKVVSNHMMLNIHVSIALLCVIFYGVMLYTGRKLLSGQTEIRQKHKVFGWITYTLRILTFITSFFAINTSV